ncbi:MAG: hypothetical protein M3417_08830 [Actinomycetota bacterium]|nr:hypothetical protein [Actinomycetota bacterium]
MNDDDQLTLGFSGRHRSPLMRRLAAMAAPIATGAGAVIDDEEMLEVARAVCAAFSHDDAIGGLTRAEISARVDGTCPADLLDARIGVFVRMELLRPILDKKHQQRYVLAPAGLVGVLIVDRFSTRGGVEELLGLLDRTASALERREADAPAVAAAMESCRAMFAVFANELARLVANAPLQELLEERRFHDDSNFMVRVGDLQRLVTDQFPELDPGAYKLLLEAQRYIGAVEDLLGRVLDEGGEARNFALLDPEEYLDAARTATVDQLAAVAADIAFDPAMPWVDAGAVIEAVEKYRPRRAVRTRPPEPPAPSGEDPVEQMQARTDATTRRRVLQAEALLGGGDTKELTDSLRGSGWPGAAQTLAELLVLDGLPEQPYRVELGDALYVDADGAVTYASPVRLQRRDAQDGPGSAEFGTSEAAVEAATPAAATSRTDASPVVPRDAADD